MKSVDIIETAFGTVWLSNETVAWLESVDRDWKRLYFGRRRSKRAALVRDEVHNLQEAVVLWAKIAHTSGKKPKKF